jgi:ribosome maturation factor RimP
MPGVFRGRLSPLFCYLHMKRITAEHIKSIIAEDLKNNNLFLTDLNISKLNKISLFIDSEKGVTIENCERLSRLIERNLDREEADFELEVSSPGLDKPLKYPFQYRKNIGRQVETVTTEGRKIKGTISSADEKSFDIEYSVKEKAEGSNKKINKIKKETLTFDSVNSTIVIVKF